MKHFKPYTRIGENYLYFYITFHIPLVKEQITNFRFLELFNCRIIPLQCYNSKNQQFNILCQQQPNTFLLPEG